MNKKKPNCWIKSNWKTLLLAILAVALLAGNICVLLFVKNDNSQSAWLTLISGWVSGVAALLVGVVAYRQSKIYKMEADEKERFVDFVIESVKLVEHSLPTNVIGRKCVPKDSNLFGKYRFLITLFAYQENPLFDVNIEKTIKEEKTLVLYDLIQPMQKGEYGRTFLCKNEFMQLVAEIPRSDDLCGQYILILNFKNHFGDLFQKELYVQLKYGYICKITQGKAILVKKENNNG